MSEVDKDLSDRYRAALGDAARDEPPAHLDAAILAAAKRAVGAKPQPAGAPGKLRRWAMPLSLAAVIVLSVTVTLRIERERPEIAMPDAVPVERPKDKLMAQKPAEQPEAPPPAARQELQQVQVQEKTAPRPAARPAPAFAPEPKPEQEAKQREDSLHSAAEATRGPATSGEAQAGKIAENTAASSAADAVGARREARAMSAPAPAAAPAAAQGMLAKRELAPAEWLERIAELRGQNRNAEADEQLAEFKRRYPDYRIPEAMLERIAPRK